MERREFFNSLVSPFKKKEIQEKIIYPPYFEDSTIFDKECQDCDGICATFCQEKIIIIGEDKIPKLDFLKGGCTYCDLCAINCPTNALKIENKKQIDVMIQIDTTKCMSWGNTMCFSCKDPCMSDAIKFSGMFRPIIEENICTSCGFCIGVCPTQAITIKR